MGNLDELFGQSTTETEEPADKPEVAAETAADRGDWATPNVDDDPPEWMEHDAKPPAEDAVAEAPEEKPAEGETDKGESPAPELPPRDERGRFAKTDESGSHQVPLEAMLHERERRQRAERELEEFRKAQQKATEDEDAPDFFDDPKGAVTKTVQRELGSQREQLLTEAEARARALFFNYTERAARGRYNDYDAMREVFVEEAQRNPMLQAQLASSEDPGEFVYQQGRTIRELREVGGNLAAYRQRVEAEAFERFKAEQAAKKQRTANVPKSLNTEPSRGAGVEGGQWSGPTPLTDILPTKME